MSHTREKDWLDVVVDFFYGAIFGDLAAFILIRFPPRGRYPLWHLHFPREGWCLYFLSAALIGGALLALYRYRWPEPTLLPPAEERLSRAKWIVLWTVLIAGCGGAGLLIWLY